MSDGFTFRVPATSANLGPAFGVAGLALELFMEVRVEERGVGQVTVERPNESELKELDERHDSVVRGLRGAADRFGIELPNGLAVIVDGDVPRGCGLGTNTAEFAIGIRAACRYASESPDHDQMLSLLVELGGDPAHGAAALRGGLAVAVPVGDPKTPWRCLAMPLSHAWHCAVAAPTTPVGTAEIHRIVPASVPNAIAQRTAGRVAGLLTALASGDEGLLAPCLIDEVHVPYRQHLAPGMAEAMRAAQHAGAGGVTISGHGPAILALSTDARRATASLDAMTTAFAQFGVRCRRILCRPFRTDGAAEGA